MTLRHFQIFAAVVDEKTMHKAAEKLYISQPSVSQAIRELEEHYGVTLFERYKKRLLLTAEGEKLLSQCRVLLAGFDALNRSMEEEKEHPTLRIGASVSVGEEMLVPLIGEFEKEYPEIRTEIVVHNTEHIEKEILLGHLDLGLLESKVLSEDIKLNPFVEDRMVAVALPTHPLSGRKDVNVEELAGYDLIAREPESLARNVLLYTMQKQGIQARIKWSCTNVHTMKQAVLAGQGIALLSSLVVEKELNDGSLCEIPVQGVDGNRVIHLAVHKEKHLSPAMKVFMDFCREE